jgi:hypothetical protein
MGVILKRLGAAALVLGALYATFFRAAASADESSADPRFRRLDQLLTRRRQAIVLWSALAARDSALAHIARSSVEPGEPGIITVGFPRGVTSPEAATLIGNRWRLVGTPDSLTRSLVLIFSSAILDSIQNQMYPYSGSLLVPTQSGDVCVAMTHGALNARGFIDIVESQLDRALASCLLRAVFGLPGKGVASWLERTRYAAAQSNAWLYRPPTFVDGSGQLPWQPMYDETWNTLYAIRSSSLLGSRSGIELSIMLAPPYSIGGPALRCMSGLYSECTKTVLDSVPQVPGLPKDLTYYWGFGWPTGRAIFAVHPIGDWFLSDLIRDEGRERFARFWQSDLPVEAAFRSAFRQDLGAWTSAWGVRHNSESWGTRYSKRPALGASLESSWPFLVLAWTTIAVLIAAWTAKRRQVTP